jgi:hypothetical protein
MFLRKIIVAILFVGLSFNGFSQVRQKPQWNLSTDKKEIKVVFSLLNKYMSE